MEHNFGRPSMRVKVASLAAVALVLVGIADIVLRFNTFIGVSNGSTAVILALNAAALVCMAFLATRKAWIKRIPRVSRVLYVIFMVWSAITLIRGIWRATDYWTWKVIFTSHLFMLAVPLFVVCGVRCELFRRVPRSMIAWILFSLVLIPLALRYDSEIFSRAVIPVAFLLILIPFLERRWRAIIVLVGVTSVLMDPSYRANSIRILVSAFLLIALISKIPLKRSALNSVAVVAAILPVALLLAGIFGRFNVFRDLDLSLQALSVAVVEGGQVRDSNLAADTRTFLYEEVLGSMVKRNSLLLGEGAGAGYESAYFRKELLAAGGRTASEVGFLNAMLYSGILGVLLYASVLFSAVYHAFNHSQSRLSKILGLYLVYRWLVFFVEDVTRMDLNFVLLWVVVGLCFSREFRALRDGDLLTWFKSSNYSLQRGYGWRQL